MILCAGEALIDMLPRTSTEGEPAFAPHAGGAVFNTAIALGRLGAPTGFLAGLSTDLFGTQLAEALAASGVETGLCLRSDRPTTLAFVMLVGGQARYAFYDEATAGRMLAPADLPALPASVRALFCGGISLMAEPCGSAYEALFLREAGSRVTMLDPNIRPGFIADEAAYRARIARMIAAADILKISDEDLHWLEGPGDARDLARGLLTRGPRLVLLTRGAGGAHALTAGAECHVPAPPVQVVDTVGAGDTFNAGLLAGLARAGQLDRDTLADGVPGAELKAALDLAIRAAAVTVSRAGANPPWAADLA
ncbi:carbohydrate kinase [Rhodovulum sulfidophilum]|uniref:Carbohydrate kinase n=1 Tax=Rhodovulum visakhapatnamense TaxID=364297 RepID=A0ABS1REG4_9RHOB|nr:carbohydrate kinase [Rhodovulum visakhapatnamense]MBL3570503.1 carbohydrate kinase [Rhodovulum visakhapatnamense]MBL3578016.1 carbohydrate kinase [Rhodovulum visakhapatnamense]OLS44529.1 carbohydrate kinase [Rhodovulum sulfidophilum]